MHPSMILAAILAVGFAFAPATTTGSIRSAQELRIGNGSTAANNGMTPPKLVTYTTPEYPEEARRRGIEGVVTIQAEFDADGHFKVLRVLKGLGYGLDEAALKALQGWRFAPAYMSGRRVSVIAQIDVTFNLPPRARDRLRGIPPSDYFDRLRTRTLLIAP